MHKFRSLVTKSVGFHWDGLNQLWKQKSLLYYCVWKWRKKKYHLHRHNLLRDAELNPLYSAQAAYSNHGYVLHSWNSCFLLFSRTKGSLGVVYLLLLFTHESLPRCFILLHRCAVWMPSRCLTSSVFGPFTNSKINWTQRYARQASWGRLPSRA